MRQPRHPGVSNREGSASDPSHAPRGRRGGSPLSLHPLPVGSLWMRRASIITHMPPSPSPQEPGRTDKQIVIAVDTEERTLDALALGRLMAEATGAPAVLVTVFPYFPLQDTGSAEMTRVRDEARSALVELARSEALDAAEAQVVPGNSAARELQRVTEQPDHGADRRRLHHARTGGAPSDRWGRRTIAVGSGLPGRRRPERLHRAAPLTTGSDRRRN